MDSDDYLKFCHETYRDEFKDRDQFVPRQGFLLTGIVVLGGLVAKLSTLDRLPHSLIRIDVFFYYLGTVGAWVAVVFATIQLIFSICPRTYEQLSSLAEFDRWRAEVRVELEKPEHGYDQAEIETMFANATREALTTRLNEATERNAKQNLSRTKHFNKATYCVISAVAFLALQMCASLVYSLWHP
ncbi:MAG: hypothetical protein QOE14_1327 [Humisphaera sp.]|nr:hypothetical protein [Humisphaera sp.]